MNDYDERYRQAEGLGIHVVNDDLPWYERPNVLRAITGWVVMVLSMSWIAAAIYWVVR